MLAPINWNEVGGWYNNSKIIRVEKQHQLGVHDIDLAVQGRKAKAEIGNTRGLCLESRSLFCRISVLP